MEEAALALNIRRIVTDSDLDGVVTGAILRRWWPEAEVVFGHPGNLRAGMMDHLIDRHTAICDLPRHEDCGLSIDHHQSNEPNASEDTETVILWRPTPSAARIAYDLLSEKIDLSDLTQMMVWVDKLDGGGVTKEEFMGEHPVVWLGRIIGSDAEIALHILESLQAGSSVVSILNDPIIESIVKERKARQSILGESIVSNMKIIDRLAIVRFEDSGFRSNGYHITALAGENCDACLVIHGDVGVGFDEEDKYPVSASFYTNSFLHKNGGIFDLTKLATRFDSDGGGHANACGCRIKPLENGVVVDRMVNSKDIEKNLETWLALWSNR